MGDISILWPAMLTYMVCYTLRYGLLNFMGEQMTPPSPPNAPLMYTSFDTASLMDDLYIYGVFDILSTSVIHRVVIPGNLYFR